MQHVYDNIDDRFYHVWFNKNDKYIYTHMHIHKVIYDQIWPFVIMCIDDSPAFQRRAGLSDRMGGVL